MRTNIEATELGGRLARPWVVTRFLPAAVVLVVLLVLVPALIDSRAAAASRNAEAVGSATFRDITVPPFPDGVLELTGRFVAVDHAAGRAEFVVPYAFVDSIPAEIVAGDQVQVTCRVEWVVGGVFSLGRRELRVDVCRDIVPLRAESP